MNEKPTFPPATAMSPIEFRFRWDAAEHQRVHRAVVRDVQRRRVLRTAAMPGGVALGAGLAAYAGGGSTAVALIAALAGLLIGAVTLVVIDPIALPFVNTRMYARQHKACIPNDQIRSISAEGIEARCTTSQTLVRWEGIVRAAETPEFILFFVTADGCAIQLPKRAIGDAATLAVVRDRITGALGTRATMLNAPAVGFASGTSS